MERAEEWGSLITKIAKFTVSDFPNVEHEDVTQELWVFVLEEQHKGRLLNPDSSVALKALKTAAKAYAWELRRQHLGLSVQYAYRTTDVRALLETLFDRIEWPNAAVPADAISLLGSDGVEMSADLSIAFDRLYSNYKILIFRKFALREELNANESRYLSTAIGRLTQILNGYQPSGRHEGPGRRKVITREHAAKLVGDEV